MSADDRPIAQVRGWLADADRITVLTGAGISTDSGIPDYRGPNGVWTKNPQAQRMSSIQEYVADPEVRRRAWQSRKAHPAWQADPNDAHRALVDLEKTGKLTALVTQNIDELHPPSSPGLSPSSSLATDHHVECDVIPLPTRLPRGIASHST